MVNGILEMITAHFNEVIIGIVWLHSLELMKKWFLMLKQKEWMWIGGIPLDYIISIHLNIWILIMIIMSKCSDDCNRIDNLDEIIESIPNEKELYDYSEVIKALADPTRLKILYILSQTNELCVCEILDALNKSQSTVSHHLSILKKADLVNWEKKGLWVYYSISNPDLIKNLNLIFG